MLRLNRILRHLRGGGPPPGPPTRAHSSGGVYSLEGIKPRIEASVYVAPSAQLIGDVVLEEDSSVWFGAVVRADNDTITIGPGSNVQDGCVLHTDPGSFKHE